MLTGKILNALTERSALRIEPGRCLRHRLSVSGCRHCFHACATGAMTWTDSGLKWHEDKCSGCLLCVAVCPTDALTSVSLALGDLLQRLNEIDTPLLACTLNPQTQGHARVPCLGLLADPDLLLVLQLALGKELHLNASACADCANYRTLEPLKVAVQQTQELAVESTGAIQVIESTSQLDYREKNCSRRDFFTFLNRRSRQTGLSLVNRLRVDTSSGSYGKKSLPVLRKLLLQLGNSSPAVRELLDTKILPELTFNSACKGCTACIGICPTGALCSPDERGNPPVAVKDRCISCNLCVEFCHQSAVELTTV